MNKAEIKRQMMNLWSNTFGDSDEYVSLVFNSYFDESLIEYESKDGEIIAAMLGIPYNFGSSKINNNLRGLYLCGLATKPEFRAKGIMTKLIDKINESAVNLDYDFTFLIPANDGLMDYYKLRGYVNALYRVAQNYLTVHDFKNECLSEIKKMIDIGNTKNLISGIGDNISDVLYQAISEYEKIKVCRLSECGTEIIEKLRDYIFNTEAKTDYTILKHSKKDIEVLIRENQISSGEIYIALNESNLIIGAAISIINDDKIEIRELFYDDIITRGALLQSIADRLNGAHSSFTVFEAPAKVCHREVIWNPFSIGPASVPYLESKVEDSESVYSPGNHPQPYGMLRLLNPLHILKFMGDCSDNLKKGILISKLNDSEVLFNTVNNDKYIINCNYKKRNASDGGYLKENGVVKISVQELAEILFRPEKGSKYLSEALDIPQLPLYASLLLD